MFNGVVGEKRETLGREHSSQQRMCGLASDTLASALRQFLQRLCLIRASPSQLLPPIVWEPKESLPPTPLPPILSANPLHFQPSQPTSSTMIQGGTMCDLDLEPQGASASRAMMRCFWHLASKEVSKGLGNLQAIYTAGL